jgi:hypothetical protein
LANLQDGSESQSAMTKHYQCYNKNVSTEPGFLVSNAVFTGIRRLQQTPRFACGCSMIDSVLCRKILKMLMKKAGSGWRDETKAPLFNARRKDMRDVAVAPVGAPFPAR